MNTIDGADDLLLLLSELIVRRRKFRHLKKWSRKNEATLISLGKINLKIFHTDVD
jgi:hypothetical protein